MGSGSDESRVLCWTRVGLGNNYRLVYNEIGVGGSTLWGLQSSNSLPRVSDPHKPPVPRGIPPSDVPQSHKSIKAEIDLGDLVSVLDPVVFQQTFPSFSVATARTFSDDVTASYPMIPDHWIVVSSNGSDCPKSSINIVANPSI